MDFNKAFHSKITIWNHFPSHRCPKLVKSDKNQPQEELNIDTSLKGLCLELNPHLVSHLLGKFHRETGHPKSSCAQPSICNWANLKPSSAPVAKKQIARNLKPKGEFVAENRAFLRYFFLPKMERFHLPTIHFQLRLLWVSGRHIHTFQSNS